MKNPIPLAMRGKLYVAGIIFGVGVMAVAPDLLTALAATPEWTAVAIRATGAITALLSILSRANLTDPADGSQDTSGEPEVAVEGPAEA
jgi:hypothetical protein